MPSATTRVVAILAHRYRTPLHVRPLPAPPIQASSTAPVGMADFNLVATEGICVGRHAVVPFAVPGHDEHGQLQTQRMIPLSSFGRFRDGMVWMHTAMTAVGYRRDDGRKCQGCFSSTPVARDIAAAINAKKGDRRGKASSKVLCANGLPLPTFVEVEVRGQTLMVGTLPPFYVRVSLDVVKWLLEQLQADAAVDTLLAVQKTSPSKEFQTAVDEMAAATCGGQTTVTYAPSKRAFFARWGGQRAKGFFTIRREACGRDGRGRGTEAEVARQFERAMHWASTGEKLPNSPLAVARRKRRRCQAKPIARRCDSSSNERASSQGADTDDGSATPRRDDERTGSEAGSSAAAAAVVESESDAAGK